MSRAWDRGGGPARLAALARGRTLDLGCADRVLGDVGVDHALAELHHANGPRRLEAHVDRPVACADAGALPFADRSFETVVCHLAFMLFPEPTRVVAELARVLVPGGRFLAVLGGGPTAAGGDAFALYASLLPRGAAGASISETRWATLFGGWHLAPWERWELDLSGSFDEVWRFLATNHERVDARAAIRAAFPAEPIPCRAVCWLATATR
jgi:SAM-dependent methyltransferase